jgi:hypothetical protein
MPDIGIRSFTCRRQERMLRSGHVGVSLGGLLEPAGVAIAAPDIRLAKGTSAVRLRRGTPRFAIVVDPGADGVAGAADCASQRSGAP